MNTIVYRSQRTASLPFQGGYLSVRVTEFRTSNVLDGMNTSKFLRELLSKSVSKSHAEMENESIPGVPCANEPGATLIVPRETSGTMS